MPSDAAPSCTAAGKHEYRSMMAMSSMPTPASSRARRPPSSIAGVRANVSRWDTNLCSWQSVPDCGNTQRSSAMPNRRAASTEHMMIAAPMSTSLFEFIDFGYGQSDHPVRSRVTVVISSGDLASRIHAYSLPAATWLRSDHSAPRWREMLLGGPARRGPQRRLEHRIHLHRHVDAALGLRRQVHLEVVADHDRFVALGRLRPIERHPGLAGAHERPPRLAAGEDRHVELAGLDVERRRVDERLRAVAAHRRVAEFGRLEPEPRGEEARRVAVAPREQADDADRVGRRRPVEAGIARRGEHRLLHQRHRFERVVDAVGTMEELADADDDGCAGIESHGPHPTNRRRCRSQRCARFAGTGPDGPVLVGTNDDRR